MGGYSEAATMIQVRNYKALTRVVAAGLRSQKQNWGPLWEWNPCNLSGN